MPAVEALKSVASDLVGQFRSLVPAEFDTSITSLLTTIILPLVMLITGAVLIYDLIVLYQAYAYSSSSRRSLMSPKVLDLVKDTLGLNEDITFDTLLQSRSLESFAPVLNGIQMAMDKYGHKL